MFTSGSFLQSRVCGYEGECEHSWSGKNTFFLINANCSEQMVKNTHRSHPCRSECVCSGPGQLSPDLSHRVSHLFLGLLWFNDYFWAHLRRLFHPRTVDVKGWSSVLNPASVGPNPQLSEEKGRENQLILSADAAHMSVPNWFTGSKTSQFVKATETRDGIPGFGFFFSFPTW